jgi:outer membrane protein TolC
MLICCLVVSGGVRGQDLPSYIREAYENNSEIRAFELRYAIAEEKVNEIRRLPNTELGAGYFVSEPETRTGAQKARFTVKQMLPWFGTVSAREEYAGTMAQTGYLDYLVARRKLALSVAQSYYRLYALQAKGDVLSENIELLKTYERLALTSVEVNKASAVDVLRLQIRQNELQQQREVLREQYLAEVTGFNGLLNRDPGMAVAVSDEVLLPAEDPVSPDSLELNPELLRFDTLYESVAREELLNQKENAPAFGIGMDYIPVEKRPGLDFSDNGKDIFMPMVSFSIPIFNSGYSSRTRQNELRQLELESLKAQRRTVLETALARARSERNAARIQYRTQEQNIRQARDAEQILVRSYETGTMDFGDVLEIQELQLRFQTAKIESLRRYYEQSAIINYLINQ